MWSNHNVHLLGLGSIQQRLIAPLLSSHHFSVSQHRTIEDLLGTGEFTGASCVIADLLLYRDRPDLIQALADHPAALTTIFITHAGDLSSAVQAIKGGAVEVFEEPLNLSLLSDAVVAALKKSTQLRSRRNERVELKRRYERLTSREREILPMILGGWLVKQSAFVLGVAQITSQIHRTQIMKKMEAESIADLVRMGVKLGIRHADSFRSYTSSGLSTSVNPS